MAWKGGNNFVVEEDFFGQAREVHFRKAVLQKFAAVVVRAGERVPKAVGIEVESQFIFIREGVFSRKLRAEIFLAELQNKF